MTAAFRGWTPDRELLHSVPYAALFTTFTKHQQQQAEFTPPGSAVSKPNKKRGGRKRKGRGSSRAAEEMESLISHGGLPPFVLLLVVLLTDEVWLRLTCDGLLIKVLSAPSPPPPNTYDPIRTAQLPPSSPLSLLQIPIPHRSRTPRYWLPIYLRVPLSFPSSSLFTPSPNLPLLTLTTCQVLLLKTN